MSHALIHGESWTYGSGLGGLYADGATQPRRNVLVFLSKNPDPGHKAAKAGRASMHRQVQVRLVGQ